MDNDKPAAKNDGNDFQEDEINRINTTMEFAEKSTTEPKQ